MVDSDQAVLYDIVRGRSPGDSYKDGKLYLK